MIIHPRKQQELLTILLAATAGDATEKELMHVSRLVLEDVEWQAFVLDVMGQEAWLTWHASQAGQWAQDFADQGCSQITSTPPRDACDSSEVIRDALSDSINGPGVQQTYKQPTGSRWQLSWNNPGNDWRIKSVVAAAMLLCVGAAIGVLGTYLVGPRQAVADRIVDADTRVASVDEARILAPYEARMMHGTACVWAPDIRSRLESHDAIHSGDSMNLIAGLAELRLNWPMRGNATLRLEGPAGLVLMTDGGASLNYGKLTATVSLQYDSFVIETPVGRVLVNNNSNLGVAVSSGEVEVHVFSGEAEIAAPWTSGMQATDGLKVRAGRSIRLKSTDSGKIDLVRGHALPSRFASELSMSSDLLEISDEYIETIKKASPIVYWRMDAAVNGVVKNIMAGKYSARVIGKPNWVEERGNTSVEFGTGLDADRLRALLIADEPYRALDTEAYTIELWAKPSHYHLGTMFSLATSPGNKEEPEGMHGVLLELGGMRLLYSGIEHPGRIRFLHRNPPSSETALGTSCFSNEPYALRKWQHFVAVKDQSEMRLYVDAKLIASTKDTTRLTGDFDLVVGQIDRNRDLRPFVGQLDELAFYNRALKSEEIEQHYRLVRPKSTSKHAI